MKKLDPILRSRWNTDDASARYFGSRVSNAATVVGCIWVPMTVAAFDTLDPKYRAEASSVFHLLRNIGSSFFISLSIAEIVRTTGANYSRMTEMITPYNQALALPGVAGGWSL